MRLKGGQDRLYTELRSGNKGCCGTSVLSAHNPGLVEVYSPESIRRVKEETNGLFLCVHVAQRITRLTGTPEIVDSSLLQGKMAPKSLNPLALKLMRGVIALELVGVFGVYGLFHMMNNSRDFRDKVNRRFPSVLEVYYKSNEMAGIYGVREQDHEFWASKQD
ncbi:protein CEBPZOS-like [Xyrichtys novacula]|uniref:Protein CEBPZOS-like n=1 Tax=Xyrichtys novacula TaxID=13765 RepID=A0AAV1H0A8_XYRNO|nr:protein CEBPZOS-like [Xyrichtys novacula]